MHICTVNEEAYSDLADLWEKSVRATHNFLAEEDRIKLRFQVETQYLPILDLRVCKDHHNRYLGFVGVSENRVEMLFVDPDCRRQGVGRFLLNYAVNTMGVTALDVNEQNPQALAFYQRMGFVVKGRSALDGQGRPYPLLHLYLIDSAP